MRKLFLTGATAFALAAAGLSTVTPTANPAALLAAQDHAGRAQSLLVANAEGAGVDARANTQMLALMLFQPSDSGTG